MKIKKYKIIKIGKHTIAVKTNFYKNESISLNELAKIQKQAILKLLKNYIDDDNMDPIVCKYARSLLGENKKQNG